MRLDSLLDTSGNLSDNIAHGIGQLLDYMISRFDLLKEQIKTLVGQA